MTFWAVSFSCSCTPVSPRFTAQAALEQCDENLHVAFSVAALTCCGCVGILGILVCAGG